MSFFFCALISLFVDVYFLVIIHSNVSDYRWKLRMRWGKRKTQRSKRATKQLVNGNVCPIGPLALSKSHACTGSNFSFLQFNLRWKTTIYTRYEHIFDLIFIHNLAKAKSDLCINFSWDQSAINGKFYNVRQRSPCMFFFLFWDTLYFVNVCLSFCFEHSSYVAREIQSFFFPSVFSTKTNH